jgi:hypothetical protein
MTEQVLTGRHGAGIELRARGLQLKIQGSARFLVPEQRVVAKHLGKSDRGLQIEAAIGIYSKSSSTSDFGQHRAAAETPMSAPFYQCQFVDEASGNILPIFSRTVRRQKLASASRAPSACYPRGRRLSVALESLARK